MSTSAAIANPLFRQASGQRARPSNPHRTARVRIGSSGLCALVSRRGSAISRRIVMNNAGYWNAPADAASPLLQKQWVTLALPTALIERLRNAVYWTGDRPLVGLVAEAIENIVTQIEEVNGGAFPQRVSPLKIGRRQGKRSPVHSTPTHSPNSAYPNKLSSRV